MSEYLNKQEEIREEMYTHYQVWESSGMSIKGFAECHGLVTRTFYTWCKRFSLQAGKDIFDRPVTKKKDVELESGAGFSQIEFSPDSFNESASSPVAIIRFPGQISVECYETDLSEIVKCLSSNVCRNVVD